MIEKIVDIVIHLFLFTVWITVSIIDWTVRKIIRIIKSLMDEEKVDTDTETVEVEIPVTEEEATDESES